MVDRLVYCGVRFGLSLGEELVELGLCRTLDHGLLDVVGVALRLVVEETEEAVGEGGPRLKCHVGSPWRLTMEKVCWSWYCFG